MAVAVGFPFVFMVLCCIGLMMGVIHLFLILYLDGFVFLLGCTDVGVGSGVVVFIVTSSSFGV